ncbi:PREDICTED: tyrosine-protein phosphatase non-receptor type 9-like [Papilio polytes]|uniref:tyrosine-protein phosphatase non-receptor type 9-like n=1 Tax=Papilio polytes TaxID=76194 RepID=UPI0006762128|nr:PREDICTED: tyrosine-protein phosphatase non-receptor type 9-like [Papilio polytes]
MTDSKYTNFDYELSQKILTMLKGGYPAKLKKVLIVTAPLWFKAPFRILRLFVREKLRERVHTVSAPQLSAHVPRASLPTLEHCRNCYTNNLQNNKLDGVIDEYVISNYIPPVKTQNGVIEHEVARDMTSDRVARLEQPDAMHISDPPYTCDTGPLRQGTFHHAKLPSNLSKNRYTDVLCYDHSRVLLSQTDPEDPTTDYINANYVDGYKQKNAFICTQGPLPKTFSDFWRMVWEQGCVALVMTTGGRAQPVLRFLHLVRRAQRTALADLGDAWAGHSRGPPIVVHCSAGIGRTGTFITLEVCTSRLAAEGVADVRGAVERVRAQRAHSIQMPDQYVFCHLALLEYAIGSYACEEKCLRFVSVYFRKHI